MPQKGSSRVCGPVTRTPSGIRQLLIPEPNDVDRFNYFGLHNNIGKAKGKRAAPAFKEIEPVFGIVQTDGQILISTFSKKSLTK